MSYVAECDQCGILESGDLETVGDAVEDHEQFHDVQVKRVATDGGSGTQTGSTEHTLSPKCDYCGKDYGGSIIESTGPCVGCMVAGHGLPEVDS